MRTTLGLLDWLADPSAERGVRFLRTPSGAWEFTSYRALAGRVWATADRLREEGVPPGGTVALTMGAGPDFLTAFYGVLAAGARPAPLAPPDAFESTEACRDRLGALLAAARAGHLVTDPQHAPLLRPLAPALVLGQDVAALREPDREAPQGSGALVQFTSGSRGRPTPVAVSRAALETNIAAIRRWLGMGPGDGTATWLPPHHDMGLIGCLLTPVSHGCELRIMTPRSFLRSPAAWLGCFGRGESTLTAAPAFGLAQVVRRLTPDLVADQDWDFGGWRALITGAERIDPALLDRFAELLAPYGFSRRAFRPAYGLAEATLAVTGLPLDREPRIRVVDRRTLVPGGRVGPAEGSRHALAVTGCGFPLVDGGTVAVTDDEGRELPEEHVGEITVAGPALADGYLDEAPGRHSFAEGRLRTGDLGFFTEGELFVLGRMGDSVKCRGRAVFAEDLETAVAGVPGLEGARPAVLLGVRQGVPAALVVAERRAGPWAREALETVRRAVEGLDIQVLAAGSGTVLRTTSGKPRRRAMWQAHLDGTLAGEVVASTPAPAPPAPEDLSCRGTDPRRPRLPA